jgi:hypothetical protein
VSRNCQTLSSLPGRAGGLPMIISTIANIVLAFSITDFVIAGGISASFPIFRDQVMAHAKARTISNLAKLIVLRKGSLNEHAGVLGAGSLFFQESSLPTLLTSKTKGRR